MAWYLTYVLSFLMHEMYSNEKDIVCMYTLILKENWKYRWMSWSSQMHINIQLTGATIAVETSSKHENKA